MHTCALEFGPHGNEHFRFESIPDEILVQTKPTMVSVYKHVATDLEEMGRFEYKRMDATRMAEGLIEPIYYDHGGFAA